MKFEELIKDRYSCRKFKDTPVEKEKIEKILEAALVHRLPAIYNRKEF